MVAKGRGTSSVSVVRNLEGPLLGVRNNTSRVVSICSWNTAVVRRSAAFRGVRYGGAPLYYKDYCASVPIHIFSPNIVGHETTTNSGQ